MLCIHSVSDMRAQNDLMTPPPLPKKKSVLAREVATAMDSNEAEDSLYKH